MFQNSNFRNVQEFKLSECSRIQTFGMFKNSNFRNVQEFKLSKCSRIQTFGMFKNSNFRNVQEFKLSECSRIQTFGMFKNSNFRNVQEFKLSECSKNKTLATMFATQYLLQQNVWHFGNGPENINVQHQIKVAFQHWLKFQRWINVCLLRNCMQTKFHAGMEIICFTLYFYSSAHNSAKERTWQAPSGRKKLTLPIEQSVSQLKQSWTTASRPTLLKKRILLFIKDALKSSQRTVKTFISYF